MNLIHQNLKIAEKIRLARIFKGLSQDYLANELGVSQAAYCKIEKGQIKITANYVLSICCVLEISVSDLILYGESYIQPDLESYKKDAEYAFYLMEKIIKKLKEELKNLELKTGKSALNKEPLI